MSDMKWLAIGVAGIAVSMSVPIAVKHYADAMVSAEAAKAGLVQRIEKIDGYPPIVIWVKPSE